MSDPNDLITFNGINGATGGYAVAPMTKAALSKIALRSMGRNPLGKEYKAELLRRKLRDKQGHLGPEDGVNPKELKETGWGVIFATGADPAVYEALSPLLKMRKEQAGERYKEYYGANAYRSATATSAAESKQEFLSGHENKMGPGPANPLKVPYYLLIVGDPDSIPFTFQYQLDVQYAVGRIHFDAVGDYAAYARSVVESESGKLALARRAAIFATANPGDASTRLSSLLLATPLAAWSATQAGWTTRSYLGDEASKACLGGLLGNEAPAFLFTASHGMEYDNGDARQRAQQGALVCQEYPGPSFKGPVPSDYFFAAQDLAANAKIFGTIAMHFACYGAGTPQLSEYAMDEVGPVRALAAKGFLGMLPQRMLAHPRGGALAVIGHVERAWSYSFDWDNAGSQTTVFTSAMKRLMEGHPVGSAMEPMNARSPISVRCLANPS